MKKVYYKEGSEKLKVGDFLYTRNKPELVTEELAKKLVAKGFYYWEGLVQETKFDIIYKKKESNRR